MKKSSPFAFGISPKEREIITFNGDFFFARNSVRFFYFLFFFSLITSAQAGGGKEGTKTLGESHYSPEPQYKAAFDYRSQYVPMTDGVKLAVDIFLPKDLEEGTKVPTVVYFVRYVRTFQLKAFWRGIKDPAFGSVAEDEVKFFNSHGYAVAIVDLRGTGASYGHRDMEFSPQEVTDMGVMLDWIVAEPWSDGKTATTGISYTGTTAELALITKHPSLKACVPRSDIWDLYTDIVYPGGIRQTPFVKEWRLTTNALDQNTLAPLGKKVKTFVKWPSPVDGDKKGILLQEAMAQHKDNYDIFEGLYRVRARDEPDRGHGAELTADDCSIHARVKDVEASGVPIFRISGWFDGALSNSVFKGFWNTSNTKRVMVGPWDHGPGQYFSNATGTKTKELNIQMEVLRFFDQYVKGIDTGLENEPPVNYFTMGEQAWKASTTWPPKEVQSADMFLSKEMLTTTKIPTESSIEHFCDYATTTGYGEKGGGTRWNSLTVLYKYEDTFYGPRNAQDNLMEVFDGPVLAEDVEITGHPEVHLNVSTSTGKGHIFVYLEEVLPDGTSRYITEGMLDLDFAALTENPDYKTCFPQHSYKEKSMIELKPNEFTQTVIDLIPTSYTIKAGNRIRLAVGVADKDHFDIPAEAIRPEKINIISGGENGSFVRLPIVSKNTN
ncbi:MAG: CocE/NonD family hydrolase [Flavobacteriales bacterium]|nr:CocE/NonD family hydrolase [Flavobacteriales bacterium]